MNIIRIPVAIDRVIIIRDDCIYVKYGMDNINNLYLSGIKNEFYKKIINIKRLSVEKYLDLFQVTLKKLKTMSVIEYEEILKKDVTEMFNGASIEELKKMESKTNEKGEKVYNFDLKKIVYECYAVKKFKSLVDVFYSEVEKIKIGDEE